MTSADLSSTGITSVGTYAFNNCFVLESITIPATVTDIGDSAFYACNHATEVNYLTAHFEGGKSKIFYALGKNGEGTTFTFGPNVTVVPSQILYGANATGTTYNNVTSIVFQGQVTEIGSQALCGCMKMTTIDLPDSLRVIGDNAFKGCSALTSIEIPENVTSIGTSPKSEAPTRPSDRWRRGWL